MTGAFWICVFMIVVGVFLYIGELRWRRRNSSATPGGGSLDGKSVSETVTGADPVVSDAPDASGEAEECCGLHLVCEKDSLSPMSDEIIYYDDEELDRFIGRGSASYTPQEEEEFREVLMTLRPEDVPGWARSITLRRLELPLDVRDELLMLVNDLRAHRV